MPVLIDLPSIVLFETRHSRFFFAGSTIPRIRLLLLCFEVNIKVRSEHVQHAKMAMHSFDATTQREYNIICEEVFGIAKFLKKVKLRYFGFQLSTLTGNAISINLISRHTQHLFSPFFFHYLSLRPTQVIRLIL